MGLATTEVIIVIYIQPFKMWENIALESASWAYMADSDLHLHVIMTPLKIIYLLEIKHVL